MGDRPGTALRVKWKEDMVNWKLVYWDLLSGAAPPGDALRMGGMGMCVAGGAGKPCSNRRAGDFFEQSADLRRCEITSRANICRKKRSCFAFFASFAVKSADNLLTI